MQKGTNTCRMYVVRHGQTQWNIEDRVQGHSDSPLTEKGLAQAGDLAKMLAARKFAAVFSSDLLRARRTAEILAAEHDLAVATSDALRERKFGRIEGLRWEEAEALLGEKLLAYRAMVGDERFRHRLDEGMETDEEIVGRFLTFLREVAVGYAGKEVLVVSHGGLMRTTLIHLGFGSAQELAFGAIANTGYVVLESDGVEFVVSETSGVNKLRI